MLLWVFRDLKSALSGDSYQEFLSLLRGCTQGDIEVEDVVKEVEQVRAIASCFSHSLVPTLCHALCALVAAVRGNEQNRVSGSVW